MITMPKNTPLSIQIAPTFALLKKIPQGKVISYRDLACRIGLRNPRNIGWILQQNTDAEHAPCYKVLHSDGSLARGYKFGGAKAQEKRLRAEGIHVHSGKVGKEYFLKTK